MFYLLFVLVVCRILSFTPTCEIISHFLYVIVVFCVLKISCVRFVNIYFFALFRFQGLLDVSYDSKDRVLCIC